MYTPPVKKSTTLAERFAAAGACVVLADMADATDHGKNPPRQATRNRSHRRRIPPNGDPQII
jgi:hypothetical protein